MAQTEAEFDSSCLETHRLCCEYANRIEVELATGGNIRLEDGKPTDLWFASCIDLINSRFFAEDYSHFGITGLKVTRVTRVHNRYLRNR